MKSFEAKSEHAAPAKDEPSAAPTPEVAEPAGVTRPLVAGLAFDNDEVRRSGGEPGDPLGGTAVGPEVDSALSRLRGGGRPLPDGLAQPMGQAMGADLSNVRIHTGAEPAALARSVHATAFTVGRDIFFGQGAYAPHSPSGQRLLAHELAHTTQASSGGGSGAGPVIGRIADPAEAEADRVADNTLDVLRRQATRTEDPAADEESPLTYATDATGNRIRRKVGFEAELMVPSLGPPKGTLKYEKYPGQVTADMKSFLDGGVPYGTDMGGKAEDADVRLDSDHGGSVDRTPIVNKLLELGFVSGTPSEPRTKIEFVTAAVDELAPGANTRLRTVALALKKQLEDALAQAQSGEMKQLAAPAKAGYKTGVPKSSLESWWFLEKGWEDLDKLVKDYLATGVQDDVYLQATVGVLPSSLLKFFAQTALPGGKVELDPPSAARKQILAIVQEVVAGLKTQFKSQPEDHWFNTLDATSQEAFLGIVGLSYSYCLGDTLHQTSGGTASVVKNAVPFLIKMSPYGLMAKTATHTLQTKPPPKDFARSIGDDFKKSKYLQLAYWTETARDKAPTAVSDTKLPAKLDARPIALKERLVQGDYTDFVENMLLGSGTFVPVVTGKALPGPDKPTTDSGGVNVFWEMYNESGVPLEYRAITKRYKVSEVLGALGEIINDVRMTNMSELTEEQKAKVKEAYEK